MSTTITCPDCHQTHAVVPSIHNAHPGHTYGDRWLSDGPSATLHLTDAPGGPVSTYTWVCLCGTTLVHEEPALQSVPCVHLAPEGETCRVHVRRTVPPSDIYSNARHGAACGCCGQQGYHLVRVDRAGNLPPCLRPGAPGA